MGHLTGKTVIITGGGRAVLENGKAGSIGYGIATAYAKEGANIVITGRNVKKLEEATEELERLYGVKVLPVQADISAGADNAAIAKETVAKTMDTVVPGDVIDFVCDYYSYDGEYLDSYMLGEQLVVEDELYVSDVYINEEAANLTYQFTDIYNREYWTAPVQ